MSVYIPAGPPAAGRWRGAASGVWREWMEECDAWTGRNKAPGDRSHPPIKRGDKPLSCRHGDSLAGQSNQHLVETSPACLAWAKSFVSPGLVPSPMWYCNVAAVPFGVRYALTCRDTPLCTTTRRSSTYLPEGAWNNSLRVRVPCRFNLLHSTSYHSTNLGELRHSTHALSSWSSHTEYAYASCCTHPPASRIPEG